VKIRESAPTHAGNSFQCRIAKPAVETAESTIHFPVARIGDRGTGAFRMTHCMVNALRWSRVQELLVHVNGFQLGAASNGCVGTGSNSIEAFSEIECQRLNRRSWMAG